MNRFAFRPLPEQPLVSVLLTSYNYARYVRDAIRSVFEQTYPAIECMIVDDGSSDGSPEVIRDAITGAPVPVEVILQSNRGQAAALNAAFARARGDLIALLDSDDSWRPDKLARMVTFIREHPDGGVFQHQLDDGRGGLKQEPLLTCDIFEEWRALGRVNVAARRDIVSVFLPSTGLMFRKEVLDRVFPIPEALISCPDAYLTRTASVYGPLYSCPDVLGTWRSHADNAGRSRRFAFRKFWVPVVMPAINRYYETHGLPVRFVYSPLAVLREPPRRIASILLRRLRQRSPIR